MAVLGDAACDEDRERNDTGGVEGHEDEMRTGLWDYADQGREEDHQGDIIADPVFDVDILETDAEDEKHAECPCENCWQVLLDNMVPEVVLNEVVRSEEEHEEDNHTEAGEEDIHPVFAQEVDVESAGIMFIINGMVMRASFGVEHVHFGFMLTSIGMYVPIVRFSSMRFDSVPGMSFSDVGFGGMVVPGVAMGAVVMAEVAGGEGGDEGGEADEHRKTFESVGAVPSNRATTSLATMR